MKGQAMSHGTGEKKKSSSRRLALTIVIMIGFVALTTGPSLFSRNMAQVFIPAWLTLTVVTVAISMWFAKNLIEAEKYRDPDAGTVHTP